MIYIDIRQRIIKNDKITMQTLKWGQFHQDILQIRQAVRDQGVSSWV